MRGWAAARWRFRRQPDRPATGARALWRGAMFLFPDRSAVGGARSVSRAAAARAGAGGERAVAERPGGVRGSAGAGCGGECAGLRPLAAEVSAAAEMVAAFSGDADAGAGAERGGCAEVRRDRRARRAGAGGRQFEIRCAASATQPVSWSNCERSCRRTRRCWWRGRLWRMRSGCC